MIRHIVLIKVAEHVSGAKLDSVFLKLETLKSKIPGIISFKAGMNNSPEGLSKGYTHIFMMDFIDMESRNNYLPHPEHKAVHPDIMSILADDKDNVLVIDFELD